jgi:hypothetical protein
VERKRAIELAETILSNLLAGQDTWPLRLMTEMYVFGSFARGALAPHDLDVDIEHISDEEWPTHMVQSLSYGRDPYAAMRRMLNGGKRGCQFTFNFRERADFDLTLLWRKGDSLAVALDRLNAIAANPEASRARRNSMLPEFEGLDDWIPRPYREAICGAVDANILGLERVLLSDDPLTNGLATEHLALRWKTTSPLYRAATGIISYWDQCGIDVGKCHLHGTDVRDRDTPYFAGFGWRYFRTIPSCLSRFGGVEWIEVVHPTKTRPLVALRFVPLNVEKLAEIHWD